MRNYLDPKLIPWKRTSSLADMVDFLERGTDDCLVSFSKFAFFTLHNRSLCNRISVTSLEKPHIGGWYYSSNILQSVRNKLDKAIIEYPIWGIESTEISLGIVAVQIMLLLLLSSAGPLLIMGVVFFAATLYFRFQERNSNQQPANEIDW